MASRTQIVCLCEGTKGQSIDEVFINKLIKCLDPKWLRPWRGSNTIRLVPCGGRAAVIAKMPAELRSCLGAGADTTLMVWADLDHDCDNGDALKSHFWQEAQRNRIGKVDFDRSRVRLRQRPAGELDRVSGNGQNRRIQRGPPGETQPQRGRCGKETSGLLQRWKTSGGHASIASVVVQ